MSFIISDYTEADSGLFSISNPTLTDRPPIYTIRSIAYNGKYWIAGGDGAWRTRTFYSYEEVEATLTTARNVKAILTNLRIAIQILTNIDPILYSSEIRKIQSAFNNVNSYYKSLLNSAKTRFKYLMELNFRTRYTEIKTSHVFMISYNGINWDYVEDNPFAFRPFTTGNLPDILDYKEPIIRDIKWNSKLSLWVAVGKYNEVKTNTNPFYSDEGTLNESGGYSYAYNQELITLGSTINLGYGVGTIHGTLRDNNNFPIQIALRSVIATSPDGLNWTPRGVPLFLDSYIGVISSSWEADAFKVACSDTLTIVLGTFKRNQNTSSPTEYIATSTDCVRWSLQPKASSNLQIIPKDIAYNGAVWVIVGTRKDNNVNSRIRIQASTDGTTWTDIPPTVTDYRFLAVGWNGSTWMAIGKCVENNTTFADIFTSSSGYDWLRINRIPTYSFSSTRFGEKISLAWDGNFWIMILSVQVDSDTYKTQDGITLIPLNISGLALSTNVPLPILGGTLNFPSSLIVGYGTPTSVLRSSNELNWISSLFDIAGTNFVGATRKDLFGIVWCGAFWVVVGNPLNESNGKCIVTSTDGFIWSYPSTWLSGRYYNTITKGRDVIWTGSLAIAVGDSVATSDDGITWKSYNSPFPISNAIAWNGKTTKLTVTSFAASSNGTQVVTVTSVSGIAVGETISIQNASDNLNNGTFLITAVGTNTFTWANTLGVSKTETSTVNAHTSLYVIGGEGGIAISIDAIAWIKTSQCPLSKVYDIAWNGSIWIAVGVAIEQPIILSIDGIRWYSANTNTIVFNECNAIAWNKSLWVAVGLGDNHTIATSVDGYNWVGRGNDVLTSSGDIIGFNGTNWIAGGKGFYQLATSTNGITWTGYNAKIENCRSYANKTVSLPYTGTASLEIKALVDSGVTIITGLTTNTVELVQSLTQYYITPAELSDRQTAEITRKYAIEYEKARRFINEKPARKAAKISATKYVWEYIYWNETISQEYFDFAVVRSAINRYNVNFSSITDYQTILSETAGLKEYLSTNLSQVLTSYSFITNDNNDITIVDKNLVTIYTIHIDYKSRLVGFYEGLRSIIYHTLYEIYTTVINKYSSNELSLFLDTIGFTENTEKTKSSVLSDISYTRSLLDSTYTTARNLFVTPITTITFKTTNTFAEIAYSADGRIYFLMAILSFAASSNGQQIVTPVNGPLFFDSIIIGRYMYIKNAPDPGNNGVYLITAKTMNTITWANPDGVAGLANGEIYDWDIGKTAKNYTTQRCSSNAPYFLDEFRKFQVWYYSLDAYYSRIISMKDFRINIINKYYNDTKVRLIDWKIINNFDSTTVTAFSAPSGGIQIITVNQIENIQTNRVVTITGATNESNNVKSELVLSVSGNTFTIKNYIGVAASNQTATVNYSDSLISYTSLDKDFDSIKTTGDTINDSIQLTTDNRSITSKYAWGRWGDDLISLLTIRCKFLYENYSNIYNYSDDLLRLALKIKYSLNLLEFDRKDAIIYAEQQLTTVRNEVNYFKLTTRQSYSEELLSIRDHYLRLLTTAVYDNSLYERVTKIARIMFLASRLFPVYSTKIQNVNLAILFAEADGCRPTINGWGGALSTEKLISYPQLTIFNPSGVAATNQNATATFIIIPKINAFGAPTDRGFQQIYTSLYDNPLNPSNISMGTLITITGATNSVNNVTNSRICGYDINSGILIIYNLTGVAAVNQNAQGSRSFTLTEFKTASTTSLPPGIQTVSFIDPTSLTRDISIVNKYITITGASNSVNNLYANVTSVTQTIYGYVNVPGKQQGLNGWKYFNNVYYAIQAKTDYENDIGRSETSGVRLPYSWKVPASEVVEPTDDLFITISGNSNTNNNGTFKVLSTNGKDIRILNPNLVQTTPFVSISKILHGSNSATYTTRSPHGFSVDSYLVWSFDKFSDVNSTTLFKVSAVPSTTTFTIPQTIYWGDRLELLATIFSAPSNGIQTITFTAYNGRRPFNTNRYITITGASNSANNVTNALVLGISGNTFTISNQNGVAAANQTASVNYADYTYEFIESYTVPLTSFSNTTNYRQILTVSSIGNIQKGRLITVKNAGRGMNAVRMVPVESISGNTFTIYNRDGTTNDTTYFYITNFAASSNGTQVLTLIDNLDIVIGDNVTITNAPNSANNGTYSVTAVGTNRITWANPTGVASPTLPATATKGSNITLNVDSFETSSNGSQVVTFSGNPKIEAGQVVTIANAFDHANNGRYKVTQVGTNTLTLVNPQGVISSFNLVSVNGVGGGITLTITSFAASSNGTQVLTVTSTSDISVGHNITIRNAPNSANNGTYSVTAVGTNTVTWANPSGAATPTGPPTGSNGTTTFTITEFDSSNHHGNQLLIVTNASSVVSSDIITIQNSPNPANNGTFKIGYILSNSAFAVQNPIGVASSSAPIIGVGGGISLTVSTFGASSNGTQVLTVTSTSGVSVGNSLTLRGSQILSNNGTYLVTAVGTNTVTWANPSGISTPSGSATASNGNATISLTSFAAPSPITQVITVKSSTGFSVGNTVTVQNSFNPANNGTHLVTAVGTNTVTWANPSGIQGATFNANATLTNGITTTSVRSFETPFGGEQVVTFANNSGIEIGDNITIQNAANPNNNGTYSISAVGTNSFTWANSSGVDSSAGMPTATSGNITTTVVSFEPTYDPRALFARQNFKVKNSSGIIVNNNITITGAPNPSNNGTYRVTQVDGNTITWENRAGVFMSSNISNGVARSATTGEIEVMGDTAPMISLAPNPTVTYGTLTNTIKITAFSQPINGKQRIFTKFKLLCRKGDSITITGAGYSANNVTNAIILDIVGNMISISNQNGVYEYGSNASFVTSYQIYDITHAGTINISENLTDITPSFNGTFGKRLVQSYTPLEYVSIKDQYTKIEWDIFKNFTENQTVETLQKEITDFDTQIDALRADDEFTETFMNTKRDDDIDEIENAYLPTATTYLNSLDLKITSKIPTAISLTITAFSALTTNPLVTVLERSTSSPSVLVSTTGESILSPATSIIGGQQTNIVTYQTLTVDNAGTIEPYKNSITITGASSSGNNVTNALVIDVVGNTIKIINPNGVAGTSQTATGKYGDLVDFASSTWYDYYSETTSDSLGNMVNAINTNYNTFLTIKNTPLTAITTTKTITSFGTVNTGFDDDAGSVNTQVITVNSIGNIIARMTIRITGAANSNNNGTFKVLQVSGNTFKIENSRGVAVTNSNAGSASYISFDYSLTTAENAITAINQVQETEAYITMVKGIEVYRKRYTNAINLVRRVGRNLGRWLRMKENALKEPYAIGLLSSGTGKPFIVSIPPSDTNYWTPRPYRGFTIVGEDTVRYPTLVNGSVFTVSPLDASTIKPYYPTEQYVLNDHVSYNNNVYCCIKDNLISTSSGIKGIIPLDTINWEKVEYPNVENSFGSIVEGSPDNFAEINASNYDLYTPILKYKTGSIVSSFYRGSIISFKASSDGNQKINLNLDGIKVDNSITITNASNSANNGTFTIVSSSGSGLAITNFAASSATQVITVSNTSSISIGDNITVTGATNSSNNGTYRVTDKDGNTITWANTSGVAATPTGGTAIATTNIVAVIVTNFAASSTPQQVLTVTSSSNVQVGDTLTIQTASNASNRGTYAITDVGTNTVTWANPSGVVSSTGALTGTNGTSTVTITNFADSLPGTQNIAVSNTSGIQVGNTITIQNAVNPGNNGTYLVTVVGTDTITWANPYGVSSSIGNPTLTNGITTISVTSFAASSPRTQVVTVTSSSGISIGDNLTIQNAMIPGNRGTYVVTLVIGNKIIWANPSGVADDLNSNSTIGLLNNGLSNITINNPLGVNETTTNAKFTINNPAVWICIRDLFKNKRIINIPPSNNSYYWVKRTYPSVIYKGEPVEANFANFQSLRQLNNTPRYDPLKSYGKGDTVRFSSVQIAVTSFAASSPGSQVVTVTSSSGIIVGDLITIEDSSNSGNNGTYAVTAVSTNTFTWANSLGVSSTTPLNAYIYKYYYLQTYDEKIYIQGKPPGTTFPPESAWEEIEDPNYIDNTVMNYNTTSFYTNTSLVKYNNKHYYWFNNTTNKFFTQDIIPTTTTTQVTYLWVQFTGDSSSFPAYSSTATYGRLAAVSYDGGVYRLFINEKFFIKDIPPTSENLITKIYQHYWTEVPNPLSIPEYDNGNLRPYKNGDYVTYNDKVYFFRAPVGFNIQGQAPGTTIASVLAWVQITHPIVFTGGRFLECTSAAFPPLDGISLSITNFAASSSGTQVLTVTNTSDIRAGDMITIANASNSANNGSYGITSVGTNTVTWANPSGVSSSNNVNAVTSNYTKYPAYQSNSEYNTNDIVTYNGQLYEYVPSQLYIVGVDVTNKVYWKELRNQMVKYKNEWVEYTPNLIPKLFPPDFRPYDASKVYFENDIVSFVDTPGNIELYKCIDDSPRGFPIINKLPTSTEFWKRVTYPLTIIDGKMIEADPTNSLFKKLDELDFHEYENNWLYNKGDFVSYNGIVYECTNVIHKNVTYPDAISGISPLANSGHWEQVLSNDMDFINNTYYKSNKIFPWNPVTNKKYAKDTTVLWKGFLYKSQKEISYRLIINLNSPDDIATIKSYIPSANELLWRKIDGDWPKSIPKPYSNTETYPSFSEVMIHDFLAEEDVILSITSPFRIRIFRLIRLNRNEPQRYKYPELRIIPELGNDGFYKSGVVQGTYNLNNVPRYGTRSDDPFRLSKFAGDLKRRVTHNVLFPYLHAKNNAKSIMEMLTMQYFMPRNYYVVPEYQTLTFIDWSFPQAFNFKDNAVAPVFAEQSYNKLKETAQTFVNIFNLSETEKTAVIEPTIMPVSAFSASSNGRQVVTVLTTNGKGLRVGDIVTILRASNNLNNGSYAVTDVTSTTFTWRNLAGVSATEVLTDEQRVNSFFTRDKSITKTPINKVLSSVYFYLTKTLVDFRDNIIVYQTNKNNLKTRYYNSPFFQKMLADDPYPYLNVAALAQDPPVRCLKDLGVGDLTIIERLERTGKIPEGSVDEYHRQKRQLDDYDADVNIQLFNLKSIVSYYIMFHYKDGVIGADITLPIDYYYVDGYTYNIKDITDSYLKIDEPSISVGFCILGPDDANYKNMNSILANSYLSEDDDLIIKNTREYKKSDGTINNPNLRGIEYLSYGAIVNSSLKDSLKAPEYTLPGSQAAQDVILLTYETKNQFVKGLGNFAKGLLGLCAATFQAADMASGILSTIQFVGNWAISGKPDGEVTADMPGGTEFINFSGNLSSLKFPEFNERAVSIRNVKAEVKAYRNRLQAVKEEVMTEEDDDALGDTLITLGGLIIAYQTELDALEDVIRYQIDKETRIFQAFVPYTTLLDPSEPTKVTYDIPKKPSKAEIAYGSLYDELEKLKIMYLEGMKRNEINSLTKLRNAAIDIKNGQIKKTNDGITETNVKTQAEIDTLNERIRVLQSELDKLGSDITKHSATLQDETTAAIRAYNAVRKPATILGADVAKQRGIIGGIGGQSTPKNWNYTGKAEQKKSPQNFRDEQPTKKNLDDALKKREELERLIREAKDELAKKAMLTHIEGQKRLGILNDTDVGQIKKNIYEVLRKIQDIDNANNELNAELKQYRDDLHDAEIKQAQADDEYNKAKAEYEQQKLKVKNATDQFTRRIEATELEGKKYTFREKTVNKETSTIDYTFKKDVFTVKFLESETIYNIMKRNMPTAVLDQYSSIINNLSTNITTPIGNAYKTIMTNLKTSVAAKNALIQYNKFKPSAIKVSKALNLPQIAKGIKIGGGPLLEIIGIGVTAYSMGAFTDGETLFIDGMNEDVINI